MQVRVWKIDRGAVLEQVKRWADDLLRRVADVEAVVLFGSMARGDATAHSDVDLLIVLRQSDLPFHERHRSIPYPPVPVPVELFPYTVAEVETMLREGWGMAGPAARDGLVLAERDGAWKALIDGRGLSSTIPPRGTIGKS
ncbi:putative nucleotidyltransferase [Thermaerobacter subterraneus DSM 13965]|uniref:Nucleotidyltransferase n=1 Tax=Thermaerobacter subterraneus DSM 13965 TaxID=867903 RepID=K6QCC2_9FIRM|nr:putative nucleotidyltransferase [Thermaerobacter subterraneus DSM 13965]